MTYTTFNVFWIPLFSWGRKYLYHCNVCDYGHEISLSAVRALGGDNPMPWMHRLGFTLPLAAIALLVAFGGITSASPERASVYDLKVGDCYDEVDGDVDSVGDVAVVSCAASWEFRVLQTFSVNRTGAYPGEPYFYDQSIRCPTEADFYLFPLSREWAAGERTVLCVESR